MDVFLSWSGQQSHAVAIALRDWLPLVINRVRPFVSSADIYAGARWQLEIATHLESAAFGIVCVTAANQSQPWLNFEAGALAKAVGTSRVVPFAFDLKPSQIAQPLGQFQAQVANEAGVRALVLSINNVSAEPLGEDLLVRAVEKWWPDLSATFQTIAKGEVSPAAIVKPSRSDRDLLNEILDAVRAVGRGQRAPEPTGADGPWATDTYEGEIALWLSKQGWLVRRNVPTAVGDLPVIATRGTDLLVACVNHRRRAVGAMIGELAFHGRVAAETSLGRRSQSTRLLLAIGLQERPARDALDILHSQGIGVFVQEHNSVRLLNPDALQPASKAQT